MKLKINLPLRCLSFVAISVFLVDCTSKTDNDDQTMSTDSIDYFQDNSSVNNFTFEDDVKFRVDSTLSVYTKFLQYYEDERKNRFLILFNESRHEMVKYNFDDQKFISKIKFDVEGPKGIGEAIDGFQYVNPNMILIASRYKVTVVKEDGSMVEKFNLITKEGLSGIPSINSSNPVYFNNDSTKLYISVTPDADASIALGENALSLACIDRSKNTVAYLNSYPKVYDGIFGSNYLSSYTCKTNSDQIIMVSFVASPRLEILDLNNKTSSSFWASGKQYQQITTQLNPKASYAEYSEFYVTNPSFEQVLFDRKNDLYYRILNLPRSKDDYTDGKHWKKKNIIVISSDFKRIGEYPIENENLNFSQIITTPDGLYTTNNSDENYISSTLLNQK